MTYPETFNPKLWEQIRSNRALRVKLARESLYWFFHLYFGDHARLPTAEFQKEIYQLLEDPSVKHLVIVAFRNSGKSTIATLAYPIWAILGKQQTKFALILSQTQPLAKLHLQNIKRTFETNELLRADFGPVDEMSDEWGSMSLTLPKYDARIGAASSDQSIRGLKYGSHRPDLIIADDVEDMPSVQTQESRNRTFNWFVSEVIPAGDQYAKIINIGNLLHEDSLLMRLKEKINDGTLKGEYREYPIIDSEGKILWEGKYPNQEAIDEQRQKIIDERSWLREFCLKIVPDQKQIILPSWIRTYDLLPPQNEENEYINTFLSVDLAISERTSADCTAVVVIHAYGYESKNRRYFVSKHFINERLTYLKSRDQIERLYRILDNGKEPKVLVESVAYQQAMVEALEQLGLDTKGIKVAGDKYSRLTTAGMLFEQGKVLFPSDGSCKEIITQLLGFGIEKHDDLCDAMSLALNYIHTKVKRSFLFGWIEDDPSNYIYTTSYED
jgi:predicted phage terminase large subunit-like protein